MKILRRLAHRRTGRHVWRLAVTNGQGQPATVHLTCRPCRITKPLPAPTHPINPCFCRDARCDRWQQYVAKFVDDLGVAPTLDDIAVDEQIHIFKQGWVDRHGPTWRGPFLAAVLGGGRREVTG